MKNKTKLRLATFTCLIAGLFISPFSRKAMTIAQDIITEKVLFSRHQLETDKYNFNEDRFSQFDQIGVFSEGLAAFVQGERYGFVDYQGQIVFYLDKGFVAAEYSAWPYNHYEENLTDWIYYPEKFTKFENGLVKIIQMDLKSKTDSWGCNAYEDSPLGTAYINKIGKVVEYEKIVPLSTVYSEIGGSQGNWQSVNCDLRSNVFE